MQCISGTRPDRIQVNVRHDGIAECFIHRNIREFTDSEGNAAFASDYVKFEGDFTAAYIEAHEEELWRLYDETPVNQRFASAEEIMAEHDDAIIELYEMTIGE